MHVAVFRSTEYPDLVEFGSYFQMIVGTILPFGTIFSSNVLIIITVQHAAENRRKLESRNVNQKQKETAYLTRMLMFVSFAYVIITLPYRLFHVCMKIPVIAEIYDMTDPYWREKYALGAWILHIVWCLNNSLNFYLYCMGGGRRYREDALNVMRALCCYRPEK
jgi:hypothetical protein